MHLVKLVDGNMRQTEFNEIAARYCCCTDPATLARHFLAWKKTSLDAQDYVVANLPLSDEISLSDVLNSFGIPNHYAISMAQRWLRQQKLALHDSICGAYISRNVAKRLHDFLENAVPVRPEFNQFCADIGLRATEALYGNFLSFAHDVAKTSYHPFRNEREFWLGSENELREVILNWSVYRTIGQPSSVAGYLSVTEAAERLSITNKRLFVWLKGHTDFCVCSNGQWLVADESVKHLLDAWQEIIPIASIISDLLEMLPASKRQGARTAVLSHINKSPPWIVPDGKYPQQDKGIYYTNNAQLAQEHISAIIEQYPALPLRFLQEATGLSMPQLRSKIEAGCISAVLVDGMHFVSLAEQRRIVDFSQHYVTLDMLVGNLISDADIFDVSQRKHRDNLQNFIMQNDWWDIDYIDGADAPVDGGKFCVLISCDDAADLQNHIECWLKGYGKSHVDQIELLLKKYATKLPHTVELLRKKYLRYLSEPSKAAVDMIDTLLCWLPKEVHTLSSKERDEYFVSKFANCTLVSCDELNKFLLQAGIIKSAYIFQRTNICVETSAYSLVNYATMVAAIVCEDVIAELNLVEKAVGNKKYAELWLYVALHMFASMRGTDCTRLIVPTLDIAADEALKQIQQGQFSEDMARSMAADFVMQITNLQMRPHKTEDKGLSPTLYFNCPESCVPAFGRILAIVSAHQTITQSSHSVVKVVSRNTICNFFGPIFAEACGNKDFSGRRANKALMQATSAEADASGLAPRMAYIIASRMRSHKGSYNKLAQMTEIYLRDGSFNSLTTEEIVYLLTERGVCSFIVDNILKMYCGEKYEQLSARRQNQLIANVGVHSFVLDKAMRYTQLAMDQAVEVVQQCVKAQSARDILASIALNCATGKDQNTQCLCRAAQMRCQYPNRHGCLGCKYEIVTKALLMKLVQVYDTLWQESHETPSLEQQRNKWLANHVYAPAIAEVCAHLRGANAELEVYQQLVLEVSSNASA